MGLRAVAGAPGLVLFALVLLGAESLAADSVDIIGEVRVHRVAGDETLLDVARDNGLGYVELIAANPGTDPWLPGRGRLVLLPSAHIVPAWPREGIVINLADQRLYYFPAKGVAPLSYPIGIGQIGRETPLGTTTVKKKRVKPTWIPTPSIRAENPELPPVVPPGPDNPLGEFALDLGWPEYAIHGTNKPFSIGRLLTAGCIRLYPEDIAELFARTKIGMRVTVIDQPFKFGWRGGDLYLEAHPTQAQAESLEASGRLQPESIPDLVTQVMDAGHTVFQRLDWDAIRRAAHERRGIPVRITR